MAAITLDTMRQDAARAPHGDSNSFDSTRTAFLIGCSPRPSRGQQQNSRKLIVKECFRCSPHPSRGQQPLDPRPQVTPRVVPMQFAPPLGDSNRNAARCLYQPLLAMQPAPLTGTATRQASGYSNSCELMQPAPLTGTKKGRQETNLFLVSLFLCKRLLLALLLHIDGEGYAVVLCRHPCAAGFCCVLRGWRQLVYISVKHLSVVHQARDRLVFEPGHIPDLTIIRRVDGDRPFVLELVI